MKRKRFVKILMGSGFSRNEANRWAALGEIVGGYKELIKAMIGGM